MQLISTWDLQFHPEELEKEFEVCVHCGLYHPLEEICDSLCPECLEKTEMPA